jgi:hypothetical protein
VLDSSIAKEWRGITPLHSTRDDVKRLLGKPLFDEYPSSDVYDVKEGRANIMYVRQRCEQGLPSNWGNWNVPPGTVANITIYLKEGTPLADLKIPDIEKYKWYTDDSGATYYQLKKEGIEYQVQGEKVTGITYGPTEEDEKLLCKKEAPVIRY